MRDQIRLARELEGKPRLNFVSIKKAAAMCGVSIRTIGKRYIDGGGAHFVIGSRERNIYIKIADLKVWYESQDVSFRGKTKKCFTF